MLLRNFGATSVVLWAVLLDVTVFLVVSFFCSHLDRQCHGRIGVLIQRWLVRKEMIGKIAIVSWGKIHVDVVSGCLNTFYEQSNNHLDRWSLRIKAPTTVCFTAESVCHQVGGYSCDCPFNSTCLRTSHNLDVRPMHIVHLYYRDDCFIGFPLFFSCWKEFPFNVWNSTVVACYWFLHDHRVCSWLPSSDGLKAYETVWDFLAKLSSKDFHAYSLCHHAGRLETSMVLPPRQQRNYLECARQHAWWQSSPGQVNLPAD